MKKNLNEVKAGEVFNVAGIDFIKFYDEDGKTVAVAKNSLGDYRFGNNNNFAESKIKEMLEKEVLLKIEAEIGVENIVEHEVDLLSLDGSDKWGKINCKISLPTFDFYRKHVKTFDKYKIYKWWWLATPDSTTDLSNDPLVSCVSPVRVTFNISKADLIGVRPFLIFVSSISVSCEE